MKQALNNIRWCATLALLLEASSFKPGNVSPYFEREERFEHYLASSVAIGDMLSLAKDLSVGELVYKATKRMLEVQRGGNTHLGAIILIAPLAKAYASLGRRVSIASFRQEVEEVIARADYRDSLYYYEAIRIAKPAGLTDVERLDVRNKGTRTQIIRGKIPLLEFMKPGVAGPYINLVCYEYVTGYQISFEDSLPLFLQMLDKFESIRRAVTALSVHLLARYLDNMIIGLFGKSFAEELQRKAIEALADGDEMRAAGKLHNFLSANKANPGAIADIVASTLFIYLLMEAPPI